MTRGRCGKNPLQVLPWIAEVNGMDDEEMVNNLMIHCRYATEVWAAMLIRFGTCWAMQRTVWVVSTMEISLYKVRSQSFTEFVSVCQCREDMDWAKQQCLQKQEFGGGWSCGFNYLGSFLLGKPKQGLCRCQYAWLEYVLVCLFLRRVRQIRFLVLLVFLSWCSFGTVALILPGPYLRVL